MCKRIHNDDDDDDAIQLIFLNEPREETHSVTEKNENILNLGRPPSNTSLRPQMVPRSPARSACAGRTLSV